MDLLLHQILSGLATGGIYASVALALVMIYQATHLVNFAQGEMAMFATYLAWTLMQAGVPYWGAFFITVAAAFAGEVHGRDQGMGGALPRRGCRHAALRRRRGDPRAGRDPAGRERADPLGGDRLHRPARDLQQRRGLDLLVHHQAFPQPGGSKDCERYSAATSATAASASGSRPSSFSFL